MEFFVEAVGYFMGIDSHECEHYCHSVYVEGQFDMLTWWRKGGALVAWRNAHDWAEDRSECRFPWPKTYGLEPVVNEQEGSPIAGMTIDRMVQRTDLGVLECFGFGK